MSTQGDCVYAALNATETTETSLGTITFPVGQQVNIRAVYGSLMQPLATTGETVSGYFRLAFTTLPGKFKFPAVPLAGAAAAGVIQQPPQLIPVNLTVPAGETLTVYMTANKALTGTAEGFAGVIWE